jgi:hypothetical protein
MRHDSDLSREMVFGNKVSTFEIEMSTFFDATELTRRRFAPPRSLK